MPRQLVTLDLHDFKNADPRKREAFVKNLGDALVDIGFFALKNHGIPQDVIRQSYAQAQEFFLQPDDAKQRCEVVELKGQRGFTSFGRETAKDSKHPDLKEFYHVGRDSISPNLWPQSLPQFKHYSLGLFEYIESVSYSLLEACALYLGEPQDLFASMITGGNSILRMIHYPPVQDVSGPRIRAAAHEDINLITLLVEATDSGLEIKTREGEWIAIEVPPGHIVVDAGDMLQNVTNGLFKSTTHRVVNPPNNTSRRFSMPFFAHPRPEVDLTPRASCVEKSGGSVLFPSLLADEYLSKRLAELGL
jgi:isopenicillin N synthase-like dioxygenase